jgi:hypothetical protein
MKKFLCTIGLAISSVGALGAADFQSKQIAVPFAFKDHKATLPAGHYRVEQYIGKQMVVLVNVDTGHRVPVMREPVLDSTGKTKLTFEKVGESYKLSRVS